MGFDRAKAIRAAEKYLAQGKIPAAIQEYARVVEHDPEDFNALNTLGDLYTRVNRKADASACYRRVAEHYREQGFTLKAVAMYKKLTRLGAEDQHTALALASLYEQQGLLADARQHYLIAADALNRSGSSREALDVLRRIADLDPSNTEIRLRLAESFAAENLSDLAAEAYTEAGARLAARQQFEAARDAFNKALALRPALHAALHGLLSAHAALGTADDVAEILEQAVRDRPGDLEVRAMLARAYVDAEEAERAEVATGELVARDPSSFMLLFDVARLFLRQGKTDDAARLLEKVAEPALAARKESALAELLQEVLARNPEQMQAHRLLVRTYTSLHDEAKLRDALERLADAAEATGAVDEERLALTRLARLAPDHQSALVRLEELGGPLFEDGEGPADDGPTFESFMLEEEAGRANAGSAGGDTAAPQTSGFEQTSDFEWNAVSEPQPSAPVPPADPSASFADLNDLTDGGFEFNAYPEASAPESPAAFQEFDFNADLTGGADGYAPRSGASVERMLRQELESVDFYIEQGYADIARDTLDMLERQYGSHAEIDAYRARIEAAEVPAPTPAPPLTAPPQFEPPPAFETDASFDADTAFDTGAAFDHYGTHDARSIHEAEAPPAFDPSACEVPVGFGEPSTFERHEPPTAFEVPTAAGESDGNSRSAEPPRAGASNNSRTGGGGDGIDPGLAAIFDEFREAVEDEGVEEAGADFDTHYQMGLAYREMGLLDQAVEEFQTAAGMVSPGDGTPRFLQCCNMLGHCFMEKGMPRPAALWFRRGLEAPGHTEDEYQAMRYDLGTAYERMGDNGRAIEVLSEVYAIDVSYRGVADRLRELQQKEARG